jgi:carboxymethylenebutenolidase
MKRRNLLTAAGTLAIATIATQAQTSTAQTKTGKAVGTMVSLDKDLSGYYVTPIGVHPLTKPRFPAVIVIMEAFGLNDYVKGVCDRLAQAGYAALAPDFYQGVSFGYDNMVGAIGKLKTMKDSIAMAQFGKGLAFLAQQPNVKADGVGVVGFCMGGRFTFLASAEYAAKVKAGVAYYGGGIASPDGKADGLGRPDLLSKVAQIKAPLMFVYGTEDQLIAADEHQRIALAMSKAKKSYSINVFAQAGHGFDSDRRDSYYAPAAEEAWEMTLRFFDRHLKST